MKPLRDADTSDDEIARRAAALLRAARPVEDLGAKRRVKTRLSRAAARSSQHPWLWVFAAMVVLLLAASARAMIGRWRAQRSAARPQPERVVVTHPRARVEAPAAPAEESLERTSQPPAVAPHPQAHVVSKRSTPPSAPPETVPVARATDDRESALVVEAMTRLRRDHDPAGASALIDQYLTRFPNGVLAEEATALAIQAAQASHDASRAGELGRRYLSRWPEGRFREAATAAGESP